MSSGANYTVDYSTYKARLITAEEIAQITGNETWGVMDEISSSYYFDSLISTQSDTCKSGNTSGCNYGWLYDRTYTDCTTYGCLNNSDVDTYGYWTVSSNAAYSGCARNVSSNSYLSIHEVGDPVTGGGVRPVITVLKSKLS